MWVARLLSLLLPTMLAAVSAATARPNVLLLLVDDLRPALGCYGDRLAVTPNIDALAGQSALFRAAYAQQALCGPSRTSLLTSRRPQTTRLFDVGSYWREAAGNFTSLPQLFRENGYHTAAMGKVFHPGIVSNHSDDQPYSWSETPYHPPAQAFKNWPVCLGEDGELHANLFCPVDPSTQPMRTLPDIQTAERAARWLQDRGGRRAPTEPWLLAVGFHKPHIPLKMPMEYLNLYPIESVPLPTYPRRPDGLPAVAWNPWTDVKSRHDAAQLNISFPYGQMPDYFTRTVRQGYYAAVSYMDDLVGRLLAQLVTSGHANNTVVLLAGDHGWALGERGEWAKYSTSEDATRTPLLLHLPGITGSLAQFRQVSPLDRRRVTRPKVSADVARPEVKAGMLVSSPVELLDVMPTLAEAALGSPPPRCPSTGQQPDLCTEGRSLVGLVRRRAAARHRQEREDRPWKLGRQPTDWFSPRYQPTNVSASGRALWRFQLRTNRLDWRRLPSRTTASLHTPADFLTSSGPPSPCDGGGGPALRGAAFSQYPRPAVRPRYDSDQPRLRDIVVMGYSVRTGRFRYTEWVWYDPVALRPDWHHLVARELYDHRQGPLEAENVAEEPACRPLVEKMSRLLRTQGRGGQP